MSSTTLSILIPTYDDWEALNRLLVDLDLELGKSGTACRIVVVNDGSLSEKSITYFPNKESHIREITVVNLRANVGHQRAIAIGLSYINDNDPGDVVIMDGDGQDAPESIPRLLHEFERNKSSRVVFAERVRRSESVLFMIFYTLYRLLHLILTGIKVRFGNFSVVPADFLPKLVLSTNLWNHYAATVVASALPYTAVEIARKKRLAGESKMKFLNLVSHGLSAISVFIDRVAIRVFLFTLVSGAVVGISILVYPFPNPEIEFLAMIIFIGFYIFAVLISLLFVVNVLSSRNKLGFLPGRVYTDYIFNVSREHSK